ncbi:MAG: hypothetical protein NVS4B2_31170 [Chloroflexota bacterium]
MDPAAPGTPRSTRYNSLLNVAARGERRVPGRDTGTQMKTSIVIPTYNYGQYLAESIESALAQTRSAHEIIVVDDGSTDDSSAIARRYPVTLLQREHTGVVEAMAAGVRASTGDCFIILGADDRLAKNYLEVTVPFLENDPRVGFVYTSLTLFGVIHDFVPAKRYSVARLLATNFVHGSSLVRRRAYDETRGLEGLDLPMYEDWYMVLDLVQAGWTGARTNQTTLYYRQHGNTRNKTAGNLHEQTIAKIMLDHPALYTPDPRWWYWLHRRLFRRHPQIFTALSLLWCRAQQRTDC